VDQDHHEIWTWVNASDSQPNRNIPKQHSWKNALHSFEHALVEYVTAQQLHNKPGYLVLRIQEGSAGGGNSPIFLRGKDRVDNPDGNRCENYLRRNPIKRKEEQTIVLGSGGDRLLDVDGLGGEVIFPTSVTRMASTILRHRLRRFV